MLLTINIPAKGLLLFSSAWLSQLEQSYCRGAGVRRPFVRPVTQVSQKSLHGYRPNFMGSYLSAIPPDCFQFFFNFQILTIFFSFSFSWDHMGSKIQNTTYPTVSVQFQPNFMINMLIKGEYRVFFFVICQNLKFYGALKFLLTRTIWRWKFQNATPTMFI